MHSRLPRVTPARDRRRAQRAAVVLLGCLLGVLAAGCAETGAPTTGSDPTTPGPTVTAPTVAGPTATAPTASGSTAGTTREPAPTRRPWRRARGIDASHHQGPVDWQAVAADGIEFAYLKATEGTGFVDPRFADHRGAARAAGVRVGGYHYFQLCSPGADQARHFADVLGDLGPRELPPALDLELAGSCSTPPPREQLLAEVRAFLEVLEARTGRRTVLYLYPELEERYRLAGALDRRQWVRRLGDVPPRRPWWIWQRSQTGQVAGISGPVDLNVMKVR